MTKVEQETWLHFALGVMLWGTQISVLFSFLRNPNMSKYCEWYFPQLICECCRRLLSITFCVGCILVSSGWFARKLVLSFLPPPQILFYVYGCPADMYVYVLCICLVLEEARRRHQIPGTEVSHGCGLPCGCWELSMGLLQEQQVISDPPL